ncbi:MAG: sigma-70 family RNA polymerase sigma factor [Planctomycetota bacterium]
MLNSPSTQFVSRLRANDQAAWFELWETFGPVLRAQLTKWGRGRIGAETVRDLSQETLAALSDSIDRYDPSRGARFSTWLLAIAKHTLGDEIDRRMALKRGGGKANAELDETWMKAAPGASVDEAYEAAVFRAKVEAAVRSVEKESEFLDFEIFRMRVLEGRPGKEVAGAVGVSEPTVSRRLAKVRTSLRSEIGRVVSQYSFTQEELAEVERNGLVTDPKGTSKGRSGSGSNGNADRELDQMFDEALAEIYHRQQELRREDEQAMLE